MLDCVEVNCLKLLALYLVEDVDRDLKNLLLSLVDGLKKLLLHVCQGVVVHILLEDQWIALILIERTLQHVVSQHVQLERVVLVIIEDIGLPALVYVVNGLVNVAIGDLTLLVHDSVHVGLEGTVHVPLSALFELLQSEAAIVSDEGGSLLESGGFLQDLLYFLSRLDVEDLLQLICGASVNLIEKRDLLVALHQLLELNELLDILLLQFRGECHLPVLDVNIVLGLLR